MTVFLVAVIMISFALTAIFGRIFIPVLMTKKMGQPIREIGPRWHKSKEGTPTMGGLFFIAASGIALCVSFFICEKSELLRIWINYAMALAFGIIGMADDGKKLFEHKNDGLLPFQKLLLQFVVAAMYVLFSVKYGLFDTSVYIPFIKANIELGRTFYAFAIIFICGTVNAVNLTDGVDGLAASVTGIICVFFAAVGARTSDAAVALLSCAIFGGCTGFLVYNANPARVFMGDTGSLFLGGAVVALAFSVGSPLAVVACGIVYFIEMFSVIIQVSYFKISGGKKVFRMTPIHHHFELCGWNERKIVFAFSAVTLAFSAVTYFFA